MKIKETTFSHEVAPYTLKGEFVKEEGKAGLEQFNVEIFEEHIHKGNAYLLEGELKYNFNSVPRAEMPTLCDAAENCLAEAKAFVA